MASSKTEIIEEIFRARYAEDTKQLENSIVTLQDVSTAISAFNASSPPKEMSTRNPANFFKDFIRNRKNANTNWPTYVMSAGFTGRQVTLSNACFEFIPLLPGQLEPFPELNFASPTAETPRYLIESVSLPLASRRLGRNDEPWLIQVITRLRIVESHFSMASTRKVRQLDLLQMNVKLAGTEIDALYLAQEELEGGLLEEVIVTCEAKGGRDDILEDQIIRQAKAPFSMRQINQDVVIPIAVKCVGPSMVHVIEFAPLNRSDFSIVNSLTIASDSLFEIRPPVPGISISKKHSK